ncbi:nucleolin-like isoform X2 [Cottoperca gobio]|uniref:Nucleolin-like isoform X2 n=1 Tax=Cottoperca gobio TaxID=56716 RepID=A0A6J2RHJ9_COTGO|nr:nucleolin-like isoform X2 [Cottoperca gobio]
MAKTDATGGSKRAEAQSETVSSTKQKVGKDEAASKENRDEQDSQMDAVIEVNGSTSTVAVSWDKKSEEGGEPTEIISSAEAVDSTEVAPSESTETNMIQESGESQMDVVAGSTAAVTVAWEKKNVEGESDGVKKTPVKGKRVADSPVDASPSKKTKLINEGFCLFVGNLNNSKTFDEVKDSLANYFMTQSLLVQDIRLDRSKKHAFLDLASEMDLSKGLALNGEMIDAKPLKIAKAKVKSNKVKVKGKVKALVEEKKGAKDGKCLFLKNVPYTATKEDILKVFQKAVSVRFPGGTEGPKTGIAFLEFKNKSTAKKVRQRKQGVKVLGRILIVDSVGESNAPKVTKAKDVKRDTKAAAPPNSTLFVSNLPFNLKEKNLKNAFQKAISIDIPESLGKPKRFAFVKFATVADAAKALQSSQNLTILKREVKVQFCEMQADSSKTLIVMGLAEKTTEETLKRVFDGALSARVAVDKKTEVSKGFGFVEFKSEENCKAGKEAMEDCEIDGSKVTVAYAKDQSAQGPGPLAKPPVAPVGQEASKVGRKARKRSKKGKKGGAGTPQNAVKVVEDAVKVVEDAVKVVEDAVKVVENKV